MLHKNRKIFVAAGQLALYVSLYTVLFQAMFCWIKYGNPIGNWGIESFLYSLPFNYIPMLFISGITLFVCWKSMIIEKIWKKITIDVFALAVTVVLVNFLFPIVTGLPVSWGGTIFNGIMIGVIIELWSVSRQKKEAVFRQSLMEKEIVARKYEIIKAYVNPHFLYNTLDMLCALLEENEHEESLEFAMSLSHYYRRLTNLMNIRKSSLDDELDLVKNYLNVVKSHYGDNINLMVKGDWNGDISVVPFSIQLLVENALKHNVINDKSPMNMELLIDDERIIFRNPSNKKPDGKTSRGTGLGLNYLRHLYESHGKSVDVSAEADFFSVSLPKAI